MSKNQKKCTPKKTRRSLKKYAGLDKGVNRRNLQEYIDFDYLKQLSDEELSVLDRFCKEYYSADFRHPKTLINGKKARREIYKANNRRNFDTYSFAKLANFIKEIKPESSKANPEDALIEAIDIRMKNYKRLVTK